MRAALAAGLCAMALSLLFGINSDPESVKNVMTNQKVTFTANAIAYSIDIPDGEVRYTSAVTTPSTTYDIGLDRWITTVPMTLKDKSLFLSGYGWTVPAGGLPKKIADVEWSGEFFTNNPDYELDWKWAAAVYTMFSSDPNALQVKPAEGSFAAPFNNTDKPGTPEAFKTKVIKGATGNGGTDYVGSYSSSVRVETDEFCPIEEEQ